MNHIQHLLIYPLLQPHSSSALSTARSSENPPPTQAPHHRPSTVKNVSEKEKTRRTCLRSSFLRAISAAFSSFVIPAVLWTNPGEATGDVARSLGAGDANGVPRALGEGESAPTREGRAALAARVRAGAATGADAGAGEDSGGDVSSVTGIGTGGGAGSSNAAHGSSSSAAPPQPTPTALGPADSAGTLSNSSARVKGAVNKW